MRCQPLFALLALAAGVAECAPPPPTTTTSAPRSAAQLANAAAGVPQPSAAQLAGVLVHGFTAFTCYGICSFTGCQWDLATPPAAAFAPPDDGPDTDQWMRVYSAMGATQACLTVRHVDGFALWPTATTNYSVAASPWRGGKGDVVADFVASARKYGVSPCFYIILGFDVEANHSGVPGPAYLDRQVVALTELLTNYGPIDRLWLDNYAIGCCQPVTHEFLYCPGGGTTSTPSPACPGWQLLIDTVRAVSPRTAVVPGPDGCLVNGESAGGTYPLYHASDLPLSSYSCTRASQPFGGASFLVPESDFSMLNPGDNWFWAPGDPFLNASQILQQVNAKLEQGANLIFNVAPNSTGLIPADVEAQLQLFAAARAATFARPLAALAAPVSAACAALSFTVPVNGTFDALLIREDLSAGQVIGGYSVEARDAASGAWRALAVHGMTVGARLLDSVGTQAGVDALRFNCSSDLAPPQPLPPVSFVNAAGRCLGQPDAYPTFPCYSAIPAPGGQNFSTCPAVAASCDAAAAAWTPSPAAGGGAGQGWQELAALGAAPDAVLAVDCNSCTEGTHAKIIANSNCGCAQPVVFNESASALQLPRCPGMCLSNGVTPGAHAACAGNEPWYGTMVHVVLCSEASGASGWRRVAPAVAFSAPAAIATIAEFGAYLQQLPGAH
jgi:alpha-L-fucosidase